MAEKTTPFEHARETLRAYYAHGARNDAVDYDADARQLVIDLGHLIETFHAERTESPRGTSMHVHVVRRIARDLGLELDEQSAESVHAVAVTVRERLTAAIDPGPMLFPGECLTDGCALVNTAHRYTQCTTDATAAPGDLAALADRLGFVRSALDLALGSWNSGQRVALTEIAHALRAHRCAPAVEVATGAGEDDRPGRAMLSRIVDRTPPPPCSGGCECRWRDDADRYDCACNGPCCQGGAFDEAWETRPDLPDDPEDVLYSLDQLREAIGVRDLSLEQALAAAARRLTTPPAPAAPQASEAASGVREAVAAVLAHVTDGDPNVFCLDDESEVLTRVELADRILAARDGALRDATPAPAVEADDDLAGWLRIAARTVAGGGILTRTERRLIEGVVTQAAERLSPPATYRATS